MATATPTDDITAEIDTAQATIADALKTLVANTGVALDSLELVDASTDPPTVKVNIALNPATGATAVPPPPTTIAGHFGVGP